MTVRKNSNKGNDVRVKNGTDMNAIIRDMISVIRESALDEELGYSSIIIVARGRQQPQCAFSQDNAHQL